jgi:hypothetical protein
MFYTDLSKYIVEGETSDVTSETAWRKVPYETAEFSGVMLTMGGCTKAKPLKIKLPVSGKYRVFLGMIYVSGETTITTLKIGEDYGKFTVRNLWMQRECWLPHEWIEETYCACEDLTDKVITIEKPQSVATPLTASIAYIRLEKAEENADEKSAAYVAKQNTGRMAFHLDTDFYYQNHYETPQDYMGKISQFKDGNGGRIVLETSFNDGEAYCHKVVPNTVAQSPIDKSYLQFYPRKEAVEQAQIDKAHENGMEILAGMRIEAADLTYPYGQTAFNTGVVAAHPECCMFTRDGKKLAALSFAYPEVRKLTVESLVRNSKNFDGVSLFFHRGTFVHFEKPVLDEVQARYGVDARKLPFTDARLHTVWCEYITLFMRELRAALDKNKKIDVFVFYDADSSKHYGFDVETWAKEGLVNSVSQGLMKVFEKLEGCLGDDGLIDLEKYKAENGKRKVVDREYWRNVGKFVCEGFPSLQKACAPYGVEVYGALPWERNEPLAYLNVAQELYALGAEKLVVWNGNHIAEMQNTLGAVKACGDKENIEKHKAREWQKYHRVLSFDGNDISSIDPNWRG